MKINTKSKNFRIILFSVIGLAVLALVILLLTLTAPPSEEENEEQTGAATTTVDPALLMQPDEVSGNVRKIQVENTLGKYSVTLSENDGASEWILDGSSIDKALLDQSGFQALAKNITNMTARSVIEENPADLSQYGLDDPQAKVTADFENGSVTLLIGDVVTSGSANYVMIEGGNTVYSYYTYLLSDFIENDEMSFVQTVVMPSYDNEAAPDILKITVTRKDMEKPIVLEILPEVPEGSDSIQVYTHAFTSPTDIYLDLTTGTEFLYGIFGLQASKAAYLEVTDETLAATGLDDPFCEVDELVEDVIYRLYIGDAITEEVTDEASGITTTEVVGYYGMSNKVPGVIYIFDPSTLIWVNMKLGDYMSKMFLMPYIYDLESVSYRDDERDFTIEITGTNEENAMYMDGKEVDGDLVRAFYQFLIACRGEEMYTDEAKGDFIAEFSYNYEDGRKPDVVTLYSSTDDRKVIIAINGVNMFKTKWNYQTRLTENAQAFLDGGEIIQNY